MDALALIGRQPELAAVETFLADSGPRALLLEGEAGIGKTVVWAAAVEACRKRGMVVLSARPGSAEVRLSFGGLSDLLDRLPTTALARLPPPQQRALDAALLRDDAPDGLVDPRAFVRPCSAFCEHSRRTVRSWSRSTTCTGSIPLPAAR